MPRGTVVIHLQATERVHVRESQTIMRDTWLPSEPYIACANNNVLKQPFQVTGEPRAVTCEQCKRTDVYSRIALTRGG